MEANENKVVPTTNACEEFLGNPDLTMDELKAAYRELDDNCAGIGDEYEKLSNAYSELEQENASLRAEVASLKKKYQIYDYYQKQCSLYEQQINALKKALSGLTSFIEAKA